MNTWDLLVDRRDLQRATIAAVDLPPECADGEVLLQVEGFALTANNVTYGRLGDQVGYWDFFPAPADLGRIPAWGHAQVVRSRAVDVPVGLRLYGYWPMSTHVAAQFEKRSAGYQEVSAHRRGLPGVYNSYRVVGEPSEDDDWRALLWPLFLTAFLLDSQLAEAGITTLVLSSASAKTALALAWLARRRRVQVIGLTSTARAEAVRDTGLFDEVCAYAELPERLVSNAAAAYVDVAGKPEVTSAVHAALGPALAMSLSVGFTHGLAGPGSSAAPGLEPVMFSAPAQMRRLAQAEGAAEVEAQAQAALARFVRACGWLTLRRHIGPEALLAVYDDVVSGAAHPYEGHIVQPI